MANITLTNVAPKIVADAHYANTSNPHSVTKSQVGLGNADNTSDLLKPLSNADVVALALKADLVGGVVPQAQLPSYVDDILEFANLAAFPVTGETGKIYIAIDTGKQYRWSGSAYIQISNGFIASTDDVPEGSTNLYFTFLRVLSGILTGFAAGANTAVTALDSLAQALAKFQGQINARPNENATTIATIANSTASKTTPVDADEVMGMDSDNSFVLIKYSWTNIKAFLKTYFDTLYTTTTAVATQISTALSGYLTSATAASTYQPKDGWVVDANTWTYSSVDGATGIISFNADMTGVLSVGMRIRLVQTTTKYFIVTAVGAFSAGATLITIYGGTDYTLANAAISSTYYSSAKEPFGFPTSPVKWDVITTDTTFRSQASPVAATWYNLGTANIIIPIGVWDVDYQVQAVQTSQITDIWTSLSTANNTEGNKLFTCRLYVGTNAVNGISLQAKSTLTLAAKTTYYLNTKTGSAAVSDITNSNSDKTLVIRARCPYL